MSLFHNRKCSDSTGSVILKSYPIIPHISCSVLQLNMQEAETYHFLFAHMVLMICTFAQAEYPLSVVVGSVL